MTDLNTNNIGEKGEQIFKMDDASVHHQPVYVSFLNDSLVHHLPRKVLRQVRIYVTLEMSNY